MLLTGICYALAPIAAAALALAIAEGPHAD
jgi:hypothetical protein